MFENANAVTASSGVASVTVPGGAGEDGAGSYITVKDIEGVNGIKADFKLNSIPTNDAGLEILFECTNNYEGWFELYVDNGSLFVGATIESGDTDVWNLATPVAVALGSTNTLELIIENNKLQVWLNDSKLGESPTYTNFTPTLLALGAWNESPSGSVSGTIDNVELYSGSSPETSIHWTEYDNFDSNAIDSNKWDFMFENANAVTASSGVASVSVPGGAGEDGAGSYITVKNIEGVNGIKADFKLNSIPTNDAGLEILFECTNNYEGWFEVYVDNGSLFVGATIESGDTDVWNLATPVAVTLGSTNTLELVIENNKLQVWLNDSKLGESPTYTNFTPTLLALGAWNESPSGSVSGTIDNVALFYNLPQVEDIYEVGLGSFATGDGTFSVECDVETNTNIVAVTLTTPSDDNVDLVLENDGGDYFWWEFENDIILQSVENGNYQITVRNASGGEFTTTIPYAKADMVTPLPSLSNPSVVTSPVNLNELTLQASEDFVVSWSNPDTESNIIVLELEKYGEGDIEIEKEYFGDGSESDGPLSTRQENFGQLTAGEWELYLINAFEVHQENSDGIEYRVWRAVESVYEFDVISGSLISSSVVDDIGGSVSQSADSAEAGESVTFTADSDEGYEVEGWYINDEVEFAQIGGENFTVENIQDDLEVSVKFKKKVYTVTFSIEDGGTITVGDQPVQSPYSVEHGASLDNIVAIANEGAEFFGFKEDYISSDDTIVELIVTSNMTIEVVFAVDVDGNGLPDEWEDAVNTSGGDFDADGDDDEDGISNLEEFLNDSDPFSFDIVMNPGWNLVHIPRILGGENNDLSSLFTEKRGEMWRWLPGGGFYDPVYTIEVGAGVWVFWDAEREIINIPGEAPDTQNISLLKGWNLVGTIYRATIPQNDVINLIFFWDSQLQIYETLESSELMPGIGYWLESSGEYNFNLGE